MSIKAPELIQATQRVNQLFESTGMDVDPFEKAIGVSQGTIKNIRNGRNLVSADCIIKVAKYLHLSTDYLLCLTNEPTQLDKNLQTESPTYAVSYTNEFDKLIQDPTFMNISKLYSKLNSPQDKGIVFGFILDLAKHSGIDTKAVVGY